MKNLAEVMLNTFLHYLYKITVHLYNINIGIRLKLYLTEPSGRRKPQFVCESQNRLEINTLTEKRAKIIHIFIKYNKYTQANCLLPCEKK